MIFHMNVYIMFLMVHNLDIKSQNIINGCWINVLYFKIINFKAANAVKSLSANVCCLNHSHSVFADGFCPTHKPYTISRRKFNGAPNHEFSKILSLGKSWSHTESKLKNLTLNVLIVAQKKSNNKDNISDNTGKGLLSPNSPLSKCKSNVKLYQPSSYYLTYNSHEVHVFGINLLLHCHLIPS